MTFYMGLAIAPASQDLQQWEEQGVWLKIWPKFLSELD